MTTEEKYQQYKLLHKNFSDTYAKVYKHVMDFYPQPQKFIREATPQIDSYIDKFSDYHHPPDKDDSFEDVVYFARNFKDFASNANGMFEEYKGLHTESGNYIKTIFKLKEKNADTLEGSADYIRLIPVLSKLITGFERIKQKTDEAAKNLCQLQAEWGSLKEKMNPDKPTIWPQ